MNLLYPKNFNQKFLIFFNLKIVGIFESTQNIISNFVITNIIRYDHHRRHRVKKHDYIKCAKLCNDACVCLRRVTVRSSSLLNSLLKNYNHRHVHYKKMRGFKLKGDERKLQANGRSWRLGNNSQTFTIKFCIGW